VFRLVLFGPGPQTDADCFAPDLENAVPPGASTDARATIRAVLEEGRYAASDRIVARVSGCEDYLAGTGGRHAADDAALLHPRATVVLGGGLQAVRRFSAIAVAERTRREVRGRSGR